MWGCKRSRIAVIGRRKFPKLTTVAADGENPQAMNAGAVGSEVRSGRCEIVRKPSCDRVVGTGRRIVG